MIKSSIFGFALMIVVIIVQSTWLQAISVYSVVPDLTLIVLIYISFKNIQPQGQIIGFLSGFFHDSISAFPLGTTSFVKTAIAFTFNLFSGKFYIDRIVIPFLFGLVATVFKAIYIEFLQLFFAEHILLSYSFFSKTLWIEVLYNAVLSPPIFFLLGLFQKILIKSDKYQ